MKRVALLFAVLALLTLPALAMASGADQAATTAATVADHQMGAGVTIVDFAFGPAYIVVPAGSTVSWYNAGAAPHTATSDYGAFDTGTLGSGGGASITFWTPGVYGYHCAIHPGMVGSIVVQ